MREAGRGRQPGGGPAAAHEREGKDGSAAVQLVPSMQLLHKMSPCWPPVVPRLKSACSPQPESAAAPASGKCGLAAGSGSEACENLSHRGHPQQARPCCSGWASYSPCRQRWAATPPPHTAVALPSAAVHGALQPPLQSLQGSRVLLAAQVGCAAGPTQSHRRRRGASRPRVDQPPRFTRVPREQQAGARRSVMAAAAALEPPHAAPLHCLWCVCQHRWQLALQAHQRQCSARWRLKCQLLEVAPDAPAHRSQPHTAAVLSGRAATHAARHTRPCVPLVPCMRMSGSWHSEPASGTIVPAQFRVLDAGARQQAWLQREQEEQSGAPAGPCNRHQATPGPPVEPRAAAQRQRYP